MVATRCQRALEAKRESNAKCLLYMLPQELLLIICQFLGLSLQIKTVHLFLRRQPALCSRHAAWCSRGRDFPKGMRRSISRCGKTVWHLMQASWYLRSLVRPLYMAHTIHFICLYQLSAYQQSVFCNDKLGSQHPLIRVFIGSSTSAPLLPLLTSGLYHNEIHLECPWLPEIYPGGHLDRWTSALGCLVELRHEVWIGLLLQHVKDLSLDIRGDIRLIPDPRYFAAQPDLRDLMANLAPLRLHLRAGLYILLLPRRNIKCETEKTEFRPDDLGNHYWKKGAQLGRIRGVEHHREAGDYRFDVTPTKEFIASGCNLWEVGIGVRWLKRYAQEAVWLRVFPAVGGDVEEDGFEWRECDGEEDLDWCPTNIKNETSSEEDESEDSDADDVVDWRREWRDRTNRSAWEGDVEEDSAWRSLENMAVGGGEYEDELDL